MLLAFLALTSGVASACGGVLTPATLDTKNDACASCRMAVSNPKLAAQIVAAGEEPRFFDDLGCLAAYVREHGEPAGSAIFVADHVTGKWVLLRAAVFARVPEIETPMGSHLVAHASLHSREADPSARSGVAVSREEIFGEAR